MVFNNNLLLGASTGGYEIEQSIRFNSADSATMSRSFGTPTDRNKWTYAYWIKSTTEQNGGNLGTNTSGGVTFAKICFNGGAMQFFDYTSGSANIDVRTTFTSAVGKFRDYSAWYHAMFVYDSDQGTDSDRLKFYINGVQFPASDLVGPLGGSVIWPSSGYNSKFNASGTTHSISELVNGKVDGYMAEIYFIDGQALDPTSFGEFNSTTGQFVPIQYSGTFGNNGFYINGSNSSDLGEDFSGNNNDFTSSGLAAADQRVDSPTLNKTTLNSLDTGSNQTLSDGNLTVTNGSGTGTLWNRSTATQGLTYKTYWEIHADNRGSLNMGLTPTGLNVHDSVNNPAGNVGCGIQNNEIFVQDSYASESSGSITFPIVTGNYIMFAYDPDRNALWVGVEGTWKDGTGSSASSATILAEIEGSGTSYAIFTGIGSNPVPYIGQYSTSVATARFSSDDWEGTAPSGYEQLAPSALSDPTIADPTAHFDTLIYSGDGTASRSITGLSFDPNFVWLKRRDSAEQHLLFDSVRGDTLKISSNSTSAEFNANADFEGFTTGGFIVDAPASVYNTNDSGSTQVAWNWKANGSGSSNGDGATTSTVSANTTSGFSIVKWTGTGANTTLGHGLGVAPQMILIKNLADTDSWVVYHEATGATKGLALDTNALPTTASTFFNDTAPTSSVFSVGSGGRTNGSSDGMIAYCFGEVDGFSKAGSYVANASTDGPFFYCGFKPAFVIFMPIAGSGAGKWMLDAVRSPFNALDDIVQANTTAAESSGSSYHLDFLSNGFKVRTSSDFNSSGRTIAFMAFAESPFKHATARGITT